MLSVLHGCISSRATISFLKYGDNTIYTTLSKVQFIAYMVTTSAPLIYIVFPLAIQCSVLFAFFSAATVLTGLKVVGIFLH